MVFLINDEENEESDKGLISSTKKNTGAKIKAEEEDGEPEEDEEGDDESTSPESKDVLGLLDDPKTQVIFISQPSEEPKEEKPKVRVIGLIGSVDEERAAEVIYGMLLMKKSGQKEVLVDENDESKGVKTVGQPFDMIISTYGGSAFEMLGIYDMMRQTREECEILTHGVGKVMSAGVLLLAAGTKGKRKIGENCRVMIHSVIGGSHGAIHDLENEMEEIKWMQERYISILSRESAMSESHIKNLLKRKVNVYLNAKEAVELGIADIIV